MKSSNLKYKDNMKLDNTIINVMDPSFVVINKENSLVKLHDYVAKNTLISEGTIKSFAPISGVVSKINKYIYISNDYTEDEISAKKIRRKSKFKKSELINDLITYGFSEIDLLNKLSGDIKTIVINGYDDVPYMNIKSLNLISHKDDILKMLEILNDTFKESNFMLVLNSRINDLVESYSNIDGIYPFLEFKYFSNEYPLYINEMLCSKLNINESDTLVLSPIQILEMFNIIMRYKPISELLIRINNFITCESLIVNVKLGTSLGELFTKLNINLDNTKLILNNVLNGLELDIDRSFISKEMKCINIISNDENISDECIKCGKCYDVCPFKKCMNCGLCRYYCPTKQVNTKGGE